MTNSEQKITNSVMNLVDQIKNNYTNQDTAIFQSALNIVNRNSISMPYGTFVEAIDHQKMYTNVQEGQC
jgi:ribosomal protein S7